MTTNEKEEGKKSSLSTDNSPSYEELKSSALVVEKTSKAKVDDSGLMASKVNEPSVEDEFSSRKKKPEQQRLMSLSMIFLLAFFILSMVSIQNPQIYVLDEQTLVVINQSFNAFVLLIIPFILGMLGAVSRILLAGAKIGQQPFLVVSSGIMAIFSWICIKSGILLSVVAPHLDKQGLDTSTTINSSSDFYTMALVAVFSGMFVASLYFFINQRVESITLMQKENENSDQ